MLFGFILCVLTLAGCLLFALPPAWFPPSITAEAVAWDGQFARTLWICGAIFVGAQLLLAWTVLRGRTRHQSNKSGTMSHGHRGLELGWMTITAALFLTLAVLGSRGWARISTGTAGKEVIDVYAHQFAWTFRYAGPDGIFGHTAVEFINDSGGNSAGLDPADPAATDDITAANLRIPAGRDVLLRLHSRDVIHDFFVRELRTKQDIVPGMEIPLELHVDKPGSYEIACAELCGLGHSQMRSLLIVMPAAEYDRWKQTR